MYDDYMWHSILYHTTQLKKKAFVNALIWDHHVMLSLSGN